MNIAVYLGSRPGDSPKYSEMTRALGKWIGKNGFTLVYGGSAQGLMGALADSTLASGGEVIGILPNVKEIMDVKQPGLTKYIYTASVAERRSRMIELADAFVTLPGGLGTLDEISEVLSLMSLDLLWQPVVFLGANGYYEPLRKLFRHIIDTGFSDRAYYKHVLFTEDIDSMAAHILSNAGRSIS